MDRRLLEFVGIKIDAITKDQALARAKDFVESDKYHYQISVNVSKLVYARKDKRLKAAINNADIINADGMPIHIATKLMSRYRTTRMGGWDYIDGLSVKYPRFRYYFLGAEKTVVKKVVAILKEKNKLNIVGYSDGYFPRNELPDVIKKINDSNADILFIALGTPTKEYFLYEFKERLKVKFAIGVGGAFNIIAGKTKRAPKFIQQIGCEWLYRLLQEPRRMFKRYAVTNSIFVILAVREIFRASYNLFSSRTNINTRIRRL